LSLGGRSALALGYEFLDLEPSFNREAQVLTGALSWRF
jgi:hypothetical protein